MTCYFYAHVDSQNPTEELTLAKSFAQKQGIALDQVIQDDQSIKLQWTERSIYTTLKN